MKIHISSHNALLSMTLMTGMMMMMIGWMAIGANSSLCTAVPSPVYFCEINTPMQPGNWTKDAGFTFPGAGPKIVTWGATQDAYRKMYRQTFNETDYAYRVRMGRGTTTKDLQSGVAVRWHPLTPTKYLGFAIRQMRKISMWMEVDGISSKVVSYGSLSHSLVNDKAQMNFDLVATNTTIHAYLDNQFVGAIQDITQHSAIASGGHVGLFNIFKFGGGGPTTTVEEMAAYTSNNFNLNHVRENPAVFIPFADLDNAFVNSPWNRAGSKLERTSTPPNVDTFFLGDPFMTDVNVTTQIADNKKGFVGARSPLIQTSDKVYGCYFSRVGGRKYVGIWDLMGAMAVRQASLTTLQPIVTVSAVYSGDNLMCFVGGELLLAFKLSGQRAAGHVVLAALGNNQAAFNNFVQVDEVANNLNPASFKRVSNFYDFSSLNQEAIPFVVSGQATLKTGPNRFEVNAKNTTFFLGDDFFPSTDFEVEAQFNTKNGLPNDYGFRLMYTPNTNRYLSFHVNIGAKVSYFELVDDGKITTYTVGSINPSGTNSLRVKAFGNDLYAFQGTTFLNYLPNFRDGFSNPGPMIGFTVAENKMGTDPFAMDVENIKITFNVGSPVTTNTPATLYSDNFEDFVGKDHWRFNPQVDPGQWPAVAGKLSNNYGQDSCGSFGYQVSGKDTKVVVDFAQYNNFAILLESNDGCYGNNGTVMRINASPFAGEISFSKWVNGSVDKTSASSVVSFQQTVNSSTLVTVYAYEGNFLVQKGSGNLLTSYPRSSIGGNPGVIFPDAGLTDLNSVQWETVSANPGLNDRNYVLDFSTMVGVNGSSDTGFIPLNPGQGVSMFVNDALYLQKTVVQRGDPLWKSVQVSMDVTFDQSLLLFPQSISCSSGVGFYFNQTTGFIVAGVITSSGAPFDVIPGTGTANISDYIQDTMTPNKIVFSKYGSNMRLYINAKKAFDIDHPLIGSFSNGSLCLGSSLDGPISTVTIDNYFATCGYFRMYNESEPLIAVRDQDITFRFVSRSVPECLLPDKSADFHFSLDMAHTGGGKDQVTGNNPAESEFKITGVKFQSVGTALLNVWITRPGTGNLQIPVAGSPFTVTVEPGPPNFGKSYIEYDHFVSAGQNFRVTRLQIRDGAEFNITNPQPPNHVLTVDWNVVPAAANKTLLVKQMTLSPGGYFTAAVNLTIAGQYQFRVVNNANGVVLPGPFTVSVSPSPPATQFEVSGAGASLAIAGSLADVYIQPKDSFGNILNVTAQLYHCQIVDTNGIGANMTDLITAMYLPQSGQYLCRYNMTKTGNYTLFLKGIVQGKYTELTLPLPMYVLSGPVSGPLSHIVSTPTNPLTVFATYVIRIELHDIFNNTLNVDHATTGLDLLSNFDAKMSLLGVNQVQHGLYDVQFRTPPSAKNSTSTITIVYQGPIPGQFDAVLIHGPVNRWFVVDSTASLTLQPVDAGKAFWVGLIPYDQFGNQGINETAGAVWKVELKSQQFSFGNYTGAYVAPAVYNVTGINITQSGTYYFSVYKDDVKLPPLTGNPSIEVKGGFGVAGPGLTQATAGKLAQFTITNNDLFGNVKYPNPVFNLTLVGSADNSVFVQGNVSQAGSQHTYTATYIATVAQPYKIYLTVNGSHADGFPILSNGPKVFANGYSTQSFVNDTLLHGIMAGNIAALQIIAKDSYGNLNPSPLNYPSQNVNKPGGVFVYDVTLRKDGSGVIFNETAKYVTDAFYAIAINRTLASDYNIKVYVMSQGSRLAINANGFNFTIGPDHPVAEFTLLDGFYDKFTAGQNTTWNLLPKDRFNNTADEHPSNLKVVARLQTTPFENVTHADIVPQPNGGRVNIVNRVTLAGQYAVDVTMGPNNIHIVGSPFMVTAIWSKKPLPQLCFFTNQSSNVLYPDEFLRFDVYCEDRFGNSIKEDFLSYGANNLTYEVFNETTPADQPFYVWTASQGVGLIMDQAYRIQVGPAKMVQNYTIKVKVNGQQISQSPIFLPALAGDGVPDKTGVFMPTNETVAGTNFGIVVEWRDKYLNPTERNTGEFNISASGAGGSKLFTSTRQVVQFGTDRHVFNMNFTVTGVVSLQLSTNGLNIFTPRTVLVKPGPISWADTLIQVNPVLDNPNKEVEAAIYSINARYRDAFKNAIPKGQYFVANFTSTDSAKVLVSRQGGPENEQSPPDAGEFDMNIQLRGTGNYTIRIRAAGFLTEFAKPVMVVPGKVQGGSFTTFPYPQIQAGTEFVYQLTMFDQFNNPAYNANATSFYRSADTNYQDITLVNLTSTEPGKWNGTMIAYKTGSLLMRTYNEDLEASTTIVQAPIGDKTRVTLYSNNATAGNAFRFDVFPIDLFGNDHEFTQPEKWPRDTQGQTFYQGLHPKLYKASNINTELDTPYQYQGNSNNHYVYSWNFTQAGEYVFNVVSTYLGKDVLNSPFRFTIYPNLVDVRRSRILHIYQDFSAITANVSNAAMIQLRDAYGNTVNASAGDHFAKLSASVSNGPQAITPTLSPLAGTSVVHVHLGMTVRGSYSLFVRYNNVNLENSPVQISVKADVINTTMSSYAVINSTIIANQGSSKLNPVMVVYPRDQFGNNATLTTAMFVNTDPIYISVEIGGFTIDSFGVKSTAGHIMQGKLQFKNGDLFVRYHAKLIGVYLAVVKFHFNHGSEVLASTNYTVVPNSFSLLTSGLGNLPAQAADQVAGYNYAVSLQGRDKFNNIISTGGELLSVQANSTEFTFAQASVVDHNNGNYSLVFNATITGVYHVIVSWNHESKNLGSYTVIPDVIDHRTSTVTFSTNATLADVPISATILAKDSYGNDRINGADKFQVRVTGLTMGGLGVSFVSQNTYSFGPRSTVAGTRVIRVALLGNAGLELTGSGHTVVVSPAATSVGNCFATRDSNVDAGVLTTFRVQARDQFNNLKTVGGDAFSGEMTIVGTANKFPLVFTDDNNGTYHSTRSFTQAGTYSLNVKGAGDQDVPVPNFNIVIHPRPVTNPAKSKLLASPYTYTVDSSIQYINVTTYDVYGNPRQFGNDVFAVNITWRALPTQAAAAVSANSVNYIATGSSAFNAPQSDGLVPRSVGRRALLQSEPARAYNGSLTSWNVTDHKNGRYTVWFNNQVSGMYTIQVLLNNVVMGTELPVQLNPGAVVATNTLIWGDGLNRTQLQSQTANLFVQARDKYLNYLNNHDAVWRATLNEVGGQSRTVPAESPSPETEFGRFKIRYECPFAGEFGIRIQYFPPGSTQPVSVFASDPIVEVLADCALGNHRPSKFSCAVCQATFYADVKNQLLCTQCPDPVSQTSPTQATSVASCVCREQFYDRTATGCKPCPTGAECAGVDANPIAKPGFWVSASNPNQFLRCANPEACPGGSTGGCGTGYTGRLCGDCEQRFYKLSGKCLPCPDNSEWIIGMVVVVLFVFCVGLRSFAQKSRSYSLMGIALNNIQLMALFGTFSLSWPPVVLTFFDIFSLFLFNVELTSPECALPLTYWDKWYLKLALPLIVCAMMMLVQIIITFVEIKRLAWFKKKRADNPDTVYNAHSAYGGIWQFIIVPRMDLDGEANINRTNNVLWRDNMNVTWNAILVFISMAYALVTPAVLEIFVCSSHEDGVLTMDVAPTIQCGGDDWLFNLPIAIFGILFYCVGMPVFVFSNLYRSQDILETPVAETRYGSLFMKYKLDYYFWEVTMMLRKGLVFFSQVVFAGNVLFQAVLAFLVLLVCLELQLYFRPFFDRKHNTLEFGCLMTSLFLLLTGILFYADKFGNTGTSKELAQTVIIIFAIAAMVFNLLTIAASIMMTVTRKKVEVFTASNSKNLQRRLKKAEAERRLASGNHGEFSEVATMGNGESIAMVNLDSHALRTRAQGKATPTSKPVTDAEDQESSSTPSAEAQQIPTVSTPGTSTISGKHSKGWSALRSHVNDFGTDGNESDDGTVKMTGSLRLRAETINSMAQAATVYAAARGRSGTVRGRSGTVRGRRPEEKRERRTMDREWQKAEDPLELIEKQNQSRAAFELLKGSNVTQEKLERIKEVLDAEKMRRTSSEEEEDQGRGLLTVDTAAKASSRPGTSPLDKLKSMFVRDPETTSTTTTTSSPKNQRKSVTGDVEIEQIEDSDDDEDEEEENEDQEEKEEEKGEEKKDEQN